MVKVIFGAASYSDQGKFNKKDVRTEVLDLLLADGVTNLDSARLYSGSEVAIGEQEKRTQFTIDTKLEGGFGFGGAPLTKENVIKSAQESLERVGIKQFDILYIHAPDKDTPLEQTLDGINEVYKKGTFRRFGLSNYTVQQVQEVHDVASKHGWITPSVYQGNYSPVARLQETVLFPTLKKLNIKFYAYSPLAGGFLTKTAADLDAGAGRFNEQAIGGLYSKLYDNAKMRNALIKWNEIAEKEGVSKAELAYRWVAFHSPLAEDGENGVIFGASSIKQVGETAKVFKNGKLSEEAAKGIEEIWQSVKE